jgi:CheY-like chemotaxis protein
VEIATWLVDKLEDVLWIGDMVEAIIMEIDSANQRLTLSIRTLMLGRDAIKASLPPSGQPVAQSSLSVSPKISSPIPTDIRDKVGTILIVDDHDEVRSSLTEWLKHRGFTQERIAYKYLSWSWHVKAEARNGLTHQQFARYYLMKIGLGKELTRIALDPKHPYRLASETEVLALCPELRQTE